MIKQWTKMVAKKFKHQFDIATDVITIRKVTSN